MRPTLSHAHPPRPKIYFSTPIWCEERRRMAKVTGRRVVTVRHDTGSVERFLVDSPDSRLGAPDWPFMEPRPSIPHPILARAIEGAGVGDRRMYLGPGRYRSVSIVAIEPAPTRRPTDILSATAA